MTLLKRVSRSFYLSVRVLPAPMRRGVCLGYLLARASDTLADAQRDPLLLDAFEKQLRGGPPLSLPPGMANGAEAGSSGTQPASHGEMQLLSTLPELIDILDGLPAAEAGYIRNVLATIISGQRLDMLRFAGADAAHPVTLADAAQLDDYTWRVAGCVGRFWTQLGFLTLGPRFSAMPPEELDALGIRFGKGLQLVNILRDVSADLAQGRGYLPSPHAEWMEAARSHLADGLTYAAAMRLKRLHIAVALPARIGLDTLDAIRAAGPAALEHRVKIPRRRVWVHLAAACKSSWLR